ncbi:HMA2 domain-containing protein [Vibrio sp. WXL103]|uniref:HMA2 domain-containing protein n=1 Tax=Vibrio sp. WXL103 TaxID=3450710 RepID=UPI003EC5B565
MNTYIHKTNQRLRVRSDYIKQHPAAVSELITQLNDIDAIHSIKHQKHAGSVAVCFDPTELDCESLLEIMQSHGWTNSYDKPSFVEQAVVSGTKTLVKGITGMALTRLLGPSVSRVIMNLA